MHIPSLIKDETLYGVLARGMHINGYAHHLLGIEKLSGQRVTSLANLKAEVLLNSDYVIGLGCEQNLGVSVLEQHLGGEQHLNHDLVSYASGQLVNGAWKTCQLCLKEDTERFGTGTWRLLHQLPTTLICPLHDEQLSRHELKRKMLHHRFYLPMQTNSTPVSINNAIRGHLKNLAQLGHEAIADKSKPYPSSVIKQVCKRVMLDRGFLKGNALSKRVHEDFSEFFGSARLSDVMDINLGRLLNGVLGVDEVPVIQRMLLIYWWFGSWELFKLSCLWQSIFADSTETLSQSDANHDLRQYYRDHCLGYISSKPGASRQELLRIDYKAFRWLKNNDSAWLNKHLPMTRYSQLCLF
ncbi:TniQ family protein [Methylophilus sp. 5]|uniref:TniQ family protein n=1 Tax=Methylophilus sp. 5 TaxID=1112274 RepID=UPI0004914184|nr:TniQ family protein [Methylophilus sp. 5]